MSDILDVPDEHLDVAVTRVLDGHRGSSDITSDLDLLVGELAAAGTRDEQLPVHLRNTLLALVDQATTTPVALASERRPRRRPHWARSPMLSNAVAAAAVVVAVVGWWPAETSAPVAVAPPVAAVLKPAEARTELLAIAGTVTVAFAATTDAAAVGAGGDVVWHSGVQRGFMRIQGLAANDPTREQYQLWIFDAERDERYPVDGGVFDVGPGGEIVVPIKATVFVGKATLFAVTVEKPGGVVVSGRERIVLAATPI
jgi:anti-sigma-K factor RskA